MGIAKPNSGNKGVNNDLLAVLPDDRPWYTKAHLIKLHFCIFSLILFCAFSLPRLQVECQLTLDKPLQMATMVV